MRIGIDLGTTFSCAAWVNDEGVVEMIPSARDGAVITPSVVWFDGRRAVVGERANQFKSITPQNIRELFKRDMGKPVERPGGLYSTQDGGSEIAPYEFAGYRYGAAGMSALVLRKLKRDAISFLRQRGRLDPSIEERQLDLDAVITVPAQFGDVSRQDTKLAGYAAGLNVIDVINEPTAAALAYGFSRDGNQRILVFDLGGGTFDVTVLEMRNGEAHVLNTLGINPLGGRDWDEIIELYLLDTYRERTGRDLPPERGFDVKELAIRAKHELTTAEQTTVTLFEDGGVSASLSRRGTARPEANGADVFSFEDRATPLLSLISAHCERLLETTSIVRTDGSVRAAAWGDIDEIVLVGGACRMPMIPALVERLSRRHVKRHLEGVDLDTAVAVGAAMYAQHGARVHDILSHSIGVRIRRDGGDYVEPVIRKNSPLPAKVDRGFEASARAFLEVYEGERQRPDECVWRGRIELDNDEGQVIVSLEADKSGTLIVTADYPPQGRKRVELKNDLYTYEKRAVELRNRIQSVQIDG